MQRPRRRKEPELSPSFVIEELGDLRSRMCSVESSVEDMRNEVQLMTDAVNRLTSKVSEVSDELGEERDRRKKGLAKAAAQSEEFMKICNSVADNIKRLQKTSDTIVHERVAPLKQSLECLSDRMSDSEVHYDRLEAGLNDLRTARNTVVAQTDSSGGFLERAVIKLQGNVSSLQEELAEVKKGSPNKGENDKQLKFLKSQMKALMKNTADTCTHLSSGLNDVQTSALNLFAWAEQVDSCLEFNRSILGMGPNSLHKLPKLHISTSLPSHGK